MSKDKITSPLKALLKKKELKARQIIAEFDQQRMRIDDFLHTEFKNPEWFLNEMKQIVNKKSSISSEDYRRDLQNANSLFQQLVMEFARSISILGRVKETLTKKLVKQIYKDVNRLIVAQYKIERKYNALQNKVEIVIYKIGLTKLEEEFKRYPAGNLLDRYVEQLGLNAEERIKEDGLASLEGLNKEVEEETEIKVRKEDKDMIEGETPKRKGKKKKK